MSVVERALKQRVSQNLHDAIADRERMRSALRQVMALSQAMQLSSNPSNYAQLLAEVCAFGLDET